jgi:CheY-like chemotaxis protein
MTPSRKKQFLRYGITIDLVVLAIGVGWLFPELSLPVIVGVFAVATALAGWRAEWEGIAIAMVLSSAALYFAFHATPLHLAACAIASVILGAIVRLTTGNRSAVLQPATVFPLGEGAGNVVAFDSERSTATQLRAEEERAAEEKAKAGKLEKERVAAEARARKEAERVAAEKVATEKREREAAEARTRAEAERVAAEKLAAEQREREALQQRLDEERVAAEAKVVAERAATEKVAAEQREREALQRRVEEERIAAEAKRAEERVAAERAAAEKIAAEQREREALQRRLEEERIAAERAAAEKIAAEQREREALQRRLEEERVAAEARIEEMGRIAAAKLAEERVAMEARAREEAERAAGEKLAAEQRERAHAERVIAEKLAAEKKEREALQQRLEQERAAAEAAKRELEERVARDAARAASEREAMERLLHEQRAAVNAAREEAESQIAARIAEAARDADAERTRERQALERQLSEQRVAAAELERQLVREREERAAAVPPPPAPAAAPAAPRPYPQRTQVARKPEGILSTISGWFRKPAAETSASSVNLRTKKVAGNTTATRRAAAAATASSKRGKAARKPRILLLEKRRGTAETIVPKLRHRGIEVQVVERWIDAVDEIFRFRPDAFFLDCELPDFDRVYKAVTEHSPNMPLLLTGRHPSVTPAVRHAQFITRPYDLDLVIRVSQEAMSDPNSLLALQMMPPKTAKTIDTPPPVSRNASRPATTTPPLVLAKPAPEPVAPQLNNAGAEGGYEVECVNCRVTFDAADADWCSCLTKERTLVCTNCLTCFCKAPPSYKEKFWVQAPPRLFERKTAELRRQEGELAPNVEPEDVRRPLVLLVEDDEDIQVIVQRVCANLGYGFVGATNGQDGLTIARRYRPNLILSDAFMPKLDGREMCRILREEPGGADCKMVVMTGLYTDTKYKSEALKRFHIDDYLSKPVAITDLINLLQRHLEGVAGLPQQEDLHELHRRAITEQEESDDETDVPLAELLDGEGSEEPDFPDVDLAIAQPDHRDARPSGNDSYEVCCFTCNQLFDAVHAEWCTCLGRDQTLVCGHCGNCFCRAPSIYKERFWIDAPSSLFERKMIGSKRSVSMHGNPDPAELRRPLILLVEDDENIQLIVKTVVTTMGYGFIAGANGQEGLALAREYNPDLILSDAFMPKLDGREMCRLLKEDPSTARAKAIIMTGLYTDRKYRAEALSYFKVDDYVAKPLAVDDLIKLMKKHLPQDVQATM